MYRVSLANVFAHRTLRPLLEKTQATPTAFNLDSAETLAGTGIYSGMVATYGATAGTVKVADGNTDRPIGLFALDSNSVMDDLDGQPSDLKPFAVWQGGPDALFRVDSPAFDSAQTYTVGQALYAGTGGQKGKLTNQTPGGTAGKLAEVVEATSTTRLVIRLFVPSLP